MLRNGARSLARSPTLCSLISEAIPLKRSFASTSRAALNSHPSANPSTPFSSVHPSEIEHFSKLSSQWWNEHGEFGLLHSMNPVRIQFIREKLEEVWGWETAQRQLEARHSESQAEPVGNIGRTRFLDSLDVVDIGCGGGLLSESLARLGARTTGVDASSSNIGIATTHAKRDPLLLKPHVLGGESLAYLHTTAEQLVEQGKTFEIVFAMEVLEHVNGPSEFLRCLEKLVKPGGHLFLSTIARTPLSYFLTIFMAENVLHLVTPGTHTHTQYVNPDELVGFFKNDLNWFSSSTNNLPQRLQYEIRGTAYLPWKAGWVLSEPNTSFPGTQACNYFFWARKPAQ